MKTRCLVKRLPPWRNGEPLADTSIRVAGPTLLGTVSAEIFQALPGVITQITFLEVCNSGVQPAKLFCSFGADAIGTRIFSGLTIPAGGKLESAAMRVINSGQKMFAHSDQADSLTMTIHGVKSS